MNEKSLHSDVRSDQGVLPQYSTSVATVVPDVKSDQEMTSSLNIGMQITPD